jgi:hypothetical protein
MRPPRFATVLILLLLLATAGSAWAVGPLDGSYEVTVNDPAFGIFKLYIVVLQNGLNGVPFGMALLDPEGIFWTYGFGDLSPENRVTGPILVLTPEGQQELGQFDLTFDGPNVSGSIIYFSEAPVPLSGAKFF